MDKKICLKIDHCDSGVEWWKARRCQLCQSYAELRRAWIRAAVASLETDKVPRRDWLLRQDMERVKDER